MTDGWQELAGRQQNSIPLRASCAFSPALASLGAAHAASRDFSPASYVGSFDPNLIWEVLIGGIVVASFFGVIAIWVVAALRAPSARSCGAMPSSAPR